MYNNPNYDTYSTNSPNPNEYTYIHGIGFSPLLTVMRERRAIRHCANAIGITIIAFLIISYTSPSLITLLISLLFPGLRGYYLPDSAYQLISLISTVLAIGIPFLIYASVIHIPVRKALPLRAPELSIVIPALFICFGASVVASYGSSLLQMFLSFLGIYAPGNIGELPSSTQSATILYLINATLVPAVLEEFTFRGVLMQSLRRFGDSFAVIVSAILFAAAHGNIIVFPLALAVGLCMGYFVMRTGSLWTSILIHFLYNSMSVGINEIYTRLSAEATALLDSGIVIVELLLALISLIYLARSRPGIFTLKPAQTALNEKAKIKTFFSSGTIITALIILALLALMNLRAY